VVVKVWFDRQFLGDGSAYLRRAKEFSTALRRDLRSKVVATLKKVSDDSYASAEKEILQLIESGSIEGFERHWIVNGFTCSTDASGIEALKQIPGVKKIFVTNQRPDQKPRRTDPKSAPSPRPAVAQDPFDPARYQHPWYIHALRADRVWSEFGVTGNGTLNVVHDFNFIYPDHLAGNVYRNPLEIPDNGKDDDGNGCIDDCFGFNFANNSAVLTTKPNASSPQELHGTMCAAIICGTGTEKSPYEFGLAPEGHWAGVIAGSNIESAVEWAVEQNADTYSMSFSRPNLGDVRSHWRKIMEHGSFCGVYFVSGAGNFAQTVPTPVQMRTPEDIPDVVFAAAGVQRDLSRTIFSSKGPVQWKTEHYQDGIVQKPEVCAFNHGLPLLLPDGSVRPVAINGNSFAGPMFCGSIALMLSADPELLPWHLKEIITSTATDVGPKGIDDETGHGLINIYRAVKEVLRRKAIREGADPAPYEGRSPGDEINTQNYQQSLRNRTVTLATVRPNGAAANAGIQRGDVIISCDDIPIASAKQWLAILKSAGKSKLKLTVHRDTNSLDFVINADAPSLSRVRESYESPVFRYHSNGHSD
jgi:hypothetical protein